MRETDRAVELISPIHLARRALRRPAGSPGYAISRKNCRGWNPEYLASLSRAGVTIDAGAGYGTLKLCLELEVLKGCARNLEMNDLVIVETSVAKCHENDSDLHSVSDFMRDNGFRLFDIIFLACYKGLPGLMWVDLMFVPLNRNESFSAQLPGDRSMP